MRTQGFDPIANGAAKVLILGTLPGQASLQKSEYYAQPRNVFWRIMGDLFGASPQSPYAERTSRLVAAGVALWDVCHSANRPGSLDASIREDVPNDLAGFLRSHRQLRLICFNGAKAADIYRRKVILPEDLSGITNEEVLPSTSPAYAAMPYEEKLARWTVVRKRCEV
jgi:double-stranded uracil-DNA glycosylase